jgi:hypothetical protein
MVAHPDNPMIYYSPEVFPTVAAADLPNQTQTSHSQGTSRTLGQWAEEPEARTLVLAHHSAVHHQDDPTSGPSWPVVVVVVVGEEEVGLVVASVVAWCWVGVGLVVGLVEHSMDFPKGKFRRRNSGGGVEPGHDPNHLVSMTEVKSHPNLIL